MRLKAWRGSEQYQVMGDKLVDGILVYPQRGGRAGAIEHGPICNDPLE
jgi:hypothetical protein